MMFAGKRHRSEEGPAVNLPAATAIAVSAFAKLPFAGAFDALRSVADRVQAVLDNLTASTEARRQQIDQQRLHQHEAVDVRAAALEALVRDESLIRKSHLERQLCDIGKTEDVLRQEQIVLESPSAELTQSIALLPFVAVEVDTIEVQLDPAPVLHAISTFGVVFGTQPATMLFDRAFALLIGRDGVQNAATAFATFEDAAAQGNTVAAGYAASQLHAGFSVAKNETWAKKMFVDASIRGDIYSRAMVIVLEERAEKYGDAFSLFRQAASNKHVVAEYFVGLCFQKGIGCNIHEKSAAEWLQRSADQGYAIAQSALATCFENGTGVEKNFVQAAALYRSAAERGFSTAQYHLGLCYAHGIGVEQDPVQAVFWYERAADQGCANAQCNFATCLYNGVGVNKDFVRAAWWYTCAAEQGNAAAQFNLGVCNATGNGVKKDTAKAVVWYTRAADQGNANAQTNLGKCYSRGVGVVVDAVQAVKWFARAAEQGNAAALFYMGGCHVTGNGVDKSLVKAISFFERAAVLGYDKAVRCLKKIEAAAIVL
jgi:TPR repeat protein